MKALVALILIVLLIGVGIAVAGVGQPLAPGQNTPFGQQSIGAPPGSSSIDSTGNYGQSHSNGHHQ